MATTTTTTTLPVPAPEEQQQEFYVTTSSWMYRAIRELEEKTGITLIDPMLQTIAQPPNVVVVRGSVIRQVRREIEDEAAMDEILRPRFVDLSQFVATMKK